MRSSMHAAVKGECVTAGIAERLQRTRRPPKRPYSLPDIPKPKPKKQASKSTHHKLQHKHEDRLLRQDSGSTSSEQFAQPRQHHTQYNRYQQQQQQQQQRKPSLPGHASSDAAAVAKKASRGTGQRTSLSPCLDHQPMSAKQPLLYNCVVFCL